MFFLLFKIVINVRRLLTVICILLAVTRDFARYFFSAIKIDFTLLQFIYLVFFFCIMINEKIVFVFKCSVSLALIITFLGNFTFPFGQYVFSCHVLLVFFFLNYLI